MAEAGVARSIIRLAPQSISTNDYARLGNAVVVQIERGEPVAPPPTTVNTGYVYILGSAPNQPDAPGGQAAAAAAGSCLATVPALAGTYPLTVEVVYAFGPITPFVEQITGSSIQITVSSTMNTEF